MEERSGGNCVDTFKEIEKRLAGGNEVILRPLVKVLEMVLKKRNI